MAVDADAMTIGSPADEGADAFLKVTARSRSGFDGVADGADARSLRSWRTGFRRLAHSKGFVVGAAILLFWIACAVFERYISPYNPTVGNLLMINMPPSAAHWFGADYLGRDVLSRVISGARDILIIAPLATLLGTILGTSMGLVQGYFGGLVDDVSGRVVEAVLALPVVIIAFLFIVAIGPSTGTLIVVVGFSFAFLISRTVRTAVLQERELDYVAAARLHNEGALYIMFIEILPNVFGPIIVEFTVRLGYAIFTVATLSFLGFGVQPPTPDWGADIANSYQYLAAGYWWETLFAALAIASLIVGINLVADAIESFVAE